MSRGVVLSLVLIVAVAISVYADTCKKVGDKSGCSGCEKGTNGLCRWVGTTKKEGAKTITNYTCLAADKAASEVKKKANFYAASLCASPTTESTLKGESQTGEGSKRSTQGGSTVGAKKASTVYSKTVKDGNVKFKDGSTTVDRTASTQPLGGLQGDQSKKRSTGLIDLSPLPTCEAINSLRKKSPIHRADGCSGSLVATNIPVSVSKRQCKSLVQAAWTAILCIPYGTAVTGFTQTLVAELTTACAAAGCNPEWPWDYFPNSELVVPDDEAYAISSLNDEGLQLEGTAASSVSGEFEDANNYYVSTVDPETGAPVADPVPTYVDGVEVTMVQVANWDGSAMTYADVVDILENPLRQSSITTYIYSGVNIYGGYQCSPPPLSAWFRPALVGTPGVIYQVRGDIQALATDTFADAYFCAWGFGAWLQFNGTVSGEGFDCHVKNIGYVEVGEWVPFLLLGWTGGDGLGTQVQITTKEGYIGDYVHNSAPVRTLTNPNIEFVDRNDDCFAECDPKKRGAAC